MIKFGYCNQDKFLIIKYIGIIDKAVLCSFMDFIYKRTDKLSLKRVLSDFRDAEFAFEVKDLKDILKLRVDYSEGFGNSLRSIYIIKEAKETAFTSIYAKGIPSNIGTVEICSTIDYAIKWLGLKATTKEIEEKIENLDFQM